MVKEKTIKISTEFRNKLMILKYELGCKDLEEVIQRMHRIIIRMKLVKEMETKK